MAVTTPPPPSVEIDDGVIKEARRRQRRRRRGMAAATAGAAIVAGSLALLIGGGGPRGSFFHGAAFRFGPPKLTYVHGFPYLGGQPFPLSVRPYLGAGFAGLDVQTWNVGFGGVEYPQQGTPLFAGDGYQFGSSRVVHAPGGQLDWILTRRDVAAVRVSGVGTFKPVAFPGLPPSTRLVVFEPRSHERVVVTPLGAAGHPIPTSAPTPTYPGPTSYFQGGTSVPADGACRVSSSEPRARIAWGLVSTAIIATPEAIGPAFFSCLNVWYTIPRAAIEVAVLLNAQRPGAPPATLWGAVPLRGHRGIVEIPAVRYRQAGSPSPPVPVIVRYLVRNRHFSPAHARRVAERLVAAAHRPYWITLAPRLIGRRFGNAWVVVGQGSLAQEVAFLDTLHITRLDLS
jgi:hypothetical protein